MNHHASIPKVYRRSRRDSMKCYTCNSTMEEYKYMHGNVRNLYLFCGSDIHSNCPHCYISVRKAGVRPLAVPYQMRG